MVDELGAFGVRKIQLIGGEPLTLGGDITRYLDYLSGKRDNGVPYAVKNVLMNGVSLGERNTDMYTLNPMKDVVRLIDRASASLLTRKLAWPSHQRHNPPRLKRSKPRLQVLVLHV